LNIVKKLCGRKKWNFN